MPSGVPQTKADFNEGSNFDRTGQWVIAKYLDCAWVTGIVQDSRIKAGGKVQHSIVSDSPTFLIISKDKEEFRAVGSTFLVEENDVLASTEE